MQKNGSETAVDSTAHSYKYPPFFAHLSSFHQVESLTFCNAQYTVWQYPAAFFVAAPDTAKKRKFLKSADN
jgi:hypothetical protein